MAGGITLNLLVRLSIYNFELTRYYSVQIEAYFPRQINMLFVM